MFSTIFCWSKILNEMIQNFVFLFLKIKLLFFLIISAVYIYPCVCLCERSDWCGKVEPVRVLLYIRPVVLVKSLPVHRLSSCIQAGTLSTTGHFVNSQFNSRQSCIGGVRHMFLLQAVGMLPKGPFFFT